MVDRFDPPIPTHVCFLPDFADVDRDLLQVGALSVAISFPMDRTISSATLLLTQRDEFGTTSRPWKVPPTLRMRFENVRCMPF